MKVAAHGAMEGSGRRVGGMMRLPDFLIIGAMKAGTTTLYRDLAAHPRIYMPSFKEPETLTCEDGPDSGDRFGYRALFGAAHDEQICGEASTAYAKRPTFEGVADRARRRAGSQLKVIYLVRNPLDRAISHHRHESGVGHLPENLEEALRVDNTLLDYSRYAWQIEPWMDALGCGQVRIIRFESYIRDRRPTVASVSRFLGLEPRVDLVQTERIYNPSQGKPQLRGAWRSLRRNPIYDQLLRLLLPAGARTWLRHRLLPRDRKRPEPLSLAAADRFLDQVRSDADQLARLMGQSKPLWDFDEIRSRFCPDPVQGRQ